MSVFGLFGPKHGHLSLYNDLCRLHNIDRKTRQVLDRIIQAYSIQEQGRIFIDGTYIVKACSDSGFADDREMLRELSFRWFGRRT
ncbi:MAG TPA: hypothetical protein DEB39_03725 [Planctomycetaceae bacterium]|nr:hypothetical protein [Planctomycetaceae bacterium]